MSWGTGLERRGRVANPPRDAVIDTKRGQSCSSVVIWRYFDSDKESIIRHYIVPLLGGNEIPVGK